jgi:hypothetical protein
MKKQPNHSRPRPESSRNLLQEMDDRLVAEWTASGFPVTARPAPESASPRYKVTFVPRRQAEPQEPPGATRPDKDTPHPDP